VEIWTWIKHLYGSMESIFVSHNTKKKCDYSVRLLTRAEQSVNQSINQSLRKQNAAKPHLNRITGLILAN